MTSKLIVNSLAADTGVSTITFADQAKMGNSLFHSTGFTIGDSFLHSTGVNLTNINATGVITATKFVGEVSVGSSITFEDNEKAYFGTGTDFSIYHNGSASYLDETGTGGLIAKTNTAFQVFNSAGSQPAFTVTPGGAVDLYHNTTKVLETKAYGIDITGGFVATGDCSIADKITHAGDLNTAIRFPEADNISFETNSNERLRITSSGTVGIATHSPQATLHVRGSVKFTNAGLQTNFQSTETNFDVRQTNSSSWSNMTYATHPLIKWNWQSGPGDHLYLASGGNTPVTTQMAMLISDSHGVKVGRSGWDGVNSTDLSTEYVRITQTGRLDIASNNYSSGHANTKLRVGTESGSSVATAVIGSADQDVPALIITNWDGSATTNKNVIRFDNSGRGTYEIGGVGGSNEFGIFIDNFTTPKFTINNAGNTTFHSTGHIVLPSGTTAQRVNTTGALRYNNSLGNLEFYDGSSWKRVRLLESAPTSGLLAYWPFSSASRSGTTYNDVSGNGQHLTVNGTITDDTTETKFNGCIDFGTADGNHYLKSSSNSFTDIDASSGYSGVSISVWVKTTVTNNLQQWIISEGTVNTRWNYFVENDYGPKWRSVSGGDVHMTGNPGMMTGNWHHLVVTWNSSNSLVKHYRDGSFTNSGTSNVTPSFTGGYLLVGQHSSLTGNSSSYRWRGKMAHMRLYNRVLTSSEVTTLYQQW